MLDAVAIRDFRAYDTKVNDASLYPVGARELALILGPWGRVSTAHALAGRLGQLVLQGALARHAVLPSASDLAIELTMARTSIVKAYGFLVSWNLAERDGAQVIITSS